MPDIQNLNKLRETIDSIDNKIFDLLFERIKISAAIGEVKKNLKIEIFDRDRELEILAKLNGKCTERNLDFDYINNIWKIILNKSHDVQINGK